MNKFLTDIRIQFGAAKSLYRLMMINIAVYLLITITQSVFYLFTINPTFLNMLIAKLSLPANLSLFVWQPWSIITYMFLHEGFNHILFNMLILYWTGKLFTEYLGNNKLWAVYIMGGMLGGILYILSFNLFPVFQNASYAAHLLGASAGVIAVLVATATLLPDYTVHLLLIGPVKLKYVAIVSVLLYAISIPNGNAGGQIAHLGGALFGFVMIRQLRNGTDLTSWLVRIFDRSAKSKMKVVARNKEGKAVATPFGPVATQDTIDRILDKINKSGFDSLTADEKEILYKVSGKNK